MTPSYGTSHPMSARSSGAYEMVPSLEVRGACPTRVSDFFDCGGSAVSPGLDSGCDVGFFVSGRGAPDLDSTAQGLGKVVHDSSSETQTTQKTQCFAFVCCVLCGVLFFCNTLLKMNLYVSCFGWDLVFVTL